MTTLTNFIESNFIDSTIQSNPDQQVNQNPIWVLNVQNHAQTYNQYALKQYLINHSIKSFKPLIHVDTGISLIKKYPSMQYKTIDLQNGLKICQPFQNKPYFFIKTPISLRIQSNFLSNLVKNINTLHESRILKALLNESNVGKKYQNRFSLIVEGFQSMLLLNNKTSQVQSFISQLSSLHTSIKQISIFTQQNLLTKQLTFSLQRISTCLTTLISYNSIQTTWQCTSTVRRYTGYSNEQTYTLTLNKNAQRIKVSKKLNKTNTNQQTKEQKQMVESLGFVVKKGQKDKRNESQMKKMIYPYLKVQQQGGNMSTCGCGKVKQNCQYPRCYNKNEDQTQNPDDQGLIILDDQQQDQDDVDV